MRNLARLLLSVALIILTTQTVGCGSGASSNPSFDAWMARQLQASLERSVTGLGIPGAVMAVRAPDGTTWSGAAGFAEVPGTAMTTETHLRIASMTKSFTCTIILQLVDEGKIGLDETLDQVMARWFAPGVIDFAIPYSDQIRMRDLMAMRSGMANYSALPAFLALLEQQPPPAVTPQQLIRFSAESTSPASYAPDTAMEYSNTNCIVLGLVIEQVTGNSYAAELQRRIFDPLGMTRSSFPTDLAMPEPYARGYLSDGGQLVDATSMVHPTMLWAAGAIVSTAPDVQRWVHALVSGSLISPAMQAARMQMQPGTVEVWPVSYGLGIYDDQGAVGHYGNFVQAYTSYGFGFGGYDIGVITNGELAAISESGRHPARTIFWNAVRDAGIGAVAP